MKSSQRLVSSPDQHDVAFITVNTRSGDVGNLGLGMRLVRRVEALEDAPMTYAQIQRWIKRDPLLSKVSQFILHGWQEGRNEWDKELSHIGQLKTFGVVIA